MVSNPSVSLALRVSLTLSTPTLALSFTATALPAARAPFPDVFMDSSCVFSQLFPPSVTQDVLLLWMPSRLGARTGDQQS